jgi:peroxiredoxin
VVVADAAESLTGAAGLGYNNATTMNKNAAVPTTFLIDRSGRVRWLFRPDRHLERLSAADVLAAVDAHL